MSDREDNDSDAPEEFTAEHGLQLDDEIRKIQRENKARINLEEKERKRKWAQNITPRPVKAVKKYREVPESESPQKPNKVTGFLSKDIVEKLAAREKNLVVADTNEEEDEIKPTTLKKRKSKDAGFETRILNELGPPPCLQSALDFLKERKMAVPRSSAILKNSNKALRLLSSSGIIRQK